MPRLIRSIARYVVLGILSTVLADLMAMLGQEVDRIRQYRPMKKLILDMDPGAPGVSETSGRREGSA
ncbi:MAG: hypothetical protein V3T84_13575 [Phycisphaerales bacterium]